MADVLPVGTWRPGHGQGLPLGEITQDLHEPVILPMMIIQGKHDPRVPEPESAQLVDDLRKDGVNVEYQVYEDEGHDVLRFRNRVHCYNTITEFFRKNLSN